MSASRRLSIVAVAVLVILSLSALQARAHDHTRRAAQRARAVALAKAKALAEATDPAPDGACRLTIELVDADSRASLPGLVRVTSADSGKAIQLSGEIHRALNWFALAPRTTVSVPGTRLKIEALRGLATELATVEVDLSGRAEASVTIPLTTFSRPAAGRLFAGNTHLHLMNLTHAEADRYLRVVPRADNLDLVFLSYLRRIPDERHYISNVIVENSFAGGDLERLSQEGTLLANGEEHRHNFGRGGEGYGHVMLLDLQKLIRPVSIGPGIMREGTDGIPLQRGIQEARADGATVIWCHNTFGFEDIPNWVAGLLHAQNIFDGGNHGTFADTFYRYLNLGMRVPFSTGTDWFIYDFARVYVPVEGELTARQWLAGLRAGRSYITNGPFLELAADEQTIGGTIALAGPREIKITASGLGRLDFRGLELIHNGQVIATADSVAEAGHFRARFEHTLLVREPGWIALRIPLDNGTTELDRTLFAHTSPIYLEVAGRRIFQRHVAEQLIEEINTGMQVIQQQATFADAEERDAVLSVYRAGLEGLREQLAAHP